MSAQLFPRLFAGHAAEIYTLPAELIAARDAAARLDKMAPPDAPDPEDVTDELVAATLSAAATDAGFPDCSGVAEARHQRQITEDAGQVWRYASEQAAGRVTSTVHAGAEVILTKHLQPAYAAVVKELTAAFAATRQYGSPSELLLAPPKVRQAAASIDALCEQYEAIRGGRGDLEWTVSYRSTDDADGEFGEIRNANDLWVRPQHRNVGNASSPPWPTTSTRSKLEWLLNHGATVWLPTPTEQDTKWREVYAAELAAAENQRQMGAAVNMM